MEIKGLHLMSYMTLADFNILFRAFGFIALKDF